jgi:hypothetical protein
MNDDDDDDDDDNSYVTFHHRKICRYRLLLFLNASIYNKPLLIVELGASSRPVVTYVPSVLFCGPRGARL